jgi:hypothetical protein
VYANAGEDAVGNATGTAKPVMTNCIIWGNIAPTAPLLRNINGLPTISYSIVDAQSCGNIHSGVGAGVTCENGMIYNQNPLFVDADNGDFHLLPNSPAINAGLNSVITAQSINYDMDSLARIVSNTVDIGPWEFNQAAQYPPKILLSPESRTVCNGEKIILKTLVTGSQPLFFQWYKNGELLSNATTDSIKFDNISLADSGVYKCIVRNELNRTTMTEEATLKVKPVLPLSINISLSRTPTCEGDTAVFIANTINGGTQPHIEWQLNGTRVSSGSNIFSTPIVSRFHRYTAQLSSSEQCVSSNSTISNEITVPVESVDTPSITMTAAAVVACEGDILTFSTAIKNGGAAPQYQWFVNNLLLNNDLSTLQVNTLQDFDKVKCVLKSSKTCLVRNNIASNEETVFIKNRVTVGVTMTADKAEICAGDSVTFRAIGTGGGTTPQYQWFLNNNRLKDTISFVKLRIFKTTDSLKVIYKSSETCPTQNPAESTPLSIRVNETVTPTISATVSKSTICRGERVAFVSTGKSLGSSPRYTWYRNGKELNWSGENYITDSLRIDDVIHVVAQSSNSCVVERVAVSNKLSPRVRICIFGKEYGDKQALVFPNPSSEPRAGVGLVNMTGTVQIDVFTQRGQPILSKTVNNVQDDKEVNIDIPLLPDGLYIVRVVNGDFTAHKKWIIAQ